MFGIDSIIDGVTTILNKVIPDANERAKAQEQILQMNHDELMGCLNADVQQALAQTNINTEEAKSTSMFVAGWRPFIGWVCGSAFAYHFIFLPIITLILAACGVVFPLPVFDMGTLTTVLMGMLGLGGLRTYEKVKGIPSNEAK